MRLNKNRSFHVVMLLLILSFISQPVLAASFSTAMQIHVVDPAAMAMPTTGAMAEHTKDCDMGESHQDCFVQCMYCMAISFILPELPTHIMEQDSPVIHDRQFHRPNPVSHIPAQEPPQSL